MKLRVFATLLMAFTSLISSVSRAQFGYGYYMGAQPCIVTGAGGASSEDDEEAELRQDRADLRKEKRDLERDYRKLERELEEARDAISEVVKPNWASVMFEHMDKGMNCQVCGLTRPVQTTNTPDFRPPPPPVSPAPVAAPPRDTSTRIEIIEERQEERIVPQQPISDPPDDEVRQPTTPRREAPPAPVKKKRKGFSLNETNQSRMPAAAESVPSAGAQIIKSVTPIDDRAPQAGGDDWGSDIGGASYTSGDGSPTLCRPNEKPFTMNAWKRICIDGGRIDRSACTTTYYQRGGIKMPQANSCGRALDRYRKLVTQMEKTQNRLARIDDEIDRIGYQLKDMKMAGRDMEADCPSGKCYERGSTRERKSRGPSLGQTLFAGGLDLLRIGLGYKLGHDAIRADRETGNSAVVNPYVTQGLSGAYYPYATASLYGAAYGGVNGAYGCSPTIGQTGVFGPMGAAYPMVGYGPMNGGAFGYPPYMMQGYPIMSGGAFMPGGGPWGANGPWGVGQWPGGYPGYSQFPGAIAGQIAAFPYGAQMPYGSPFPYGAQMPYGAQVPYGSPFPYGSAYPYGNAAIAGQIAAFPYGAQYPYGAQMPYGSQFPYGSQMPYGSAFPYGSQFPYGAQIPGMPGYPGQNGFDSILLQRQIEAQRSRLNLYQSFIQEYSQFQSKWNMYFGSGAGGGSILTNDYYYTQPGSTGPTTNTGTGRTR